MLLQVEGYSKCLNKNLTGDEHLSNLSHNFPFCNKLHFIQLSKIAKSASSLFFWLRLNFWLAWVPLKLFLTHPPTAPKANARIQNVFDLEGFFLFSMISSVYVPTCHTFLTMSMKQKKK